MLKSSSLLAAGLLLNFFAVASADEVSVVSSLPAPAGQTTSYTQNAPPLAPAALLKLPPGAVKPQGWLRHQLELDAGGLPGRLDEISRFLQYGDGNGWVNPKSMAGEEVAYWLRGYGDLGYVLQDPRIIANTKKWLEAVIATAQPDGYFGPDPRKPATVNGVYDGKEPVPDQLILFPLRSYYEYSGDPRVLTLMTNFFKWIADAAGQAYFRTGWGAMRAGPTRRQRSTGSITGRRTRRCWPWPKRIKRIRRLNYVTDLGNGHNVNWSQGFRGPEEYAQQDPSLRGDLRKRTTTR